MSTAPPAPPPPAVAPGPVAAKSSTTRTLFGMLVSRRGQRLARLGAVLLAVGGLSAYSQFHRQPTPWDYAETDGEELHVPTREQCVQRAASGEEFDVLVIGGGATGCGVALDTTTRGLKTLLVERDDFASGTSSRSTKLIHGGVRYLEKAVLHLDRRQFALVRDALHERANMMRLAPHLTREVALVTPSYSYFKLPYYYAGMKMYDALAGSQQLQPARWLSRNAALDAFPTLRRAGLRGAVLYYDGQFDDARFATSLALTAAAHGAAVCNHTEVEALDHDSAGQIVGARLHDRDSGHRYQVRAKIVISAVGPWTDRLVALDARGGSAAECAQRASVAAADAAATAERNAQIRSAAAALVDRAVNDVGAAPAVVLAGPAAPSLVLDSPATATASTLVPATATAPDGDELPAVAAALEALPSATPEPVLVADALPKRLIQPSSGVHVILPAYYTSQRYGMLLPETHDGRVLFLLPWQGYSLAGTTDVPLKDVPDETRPTRHEVDFILSELRNVLDIDVRHDDVLSAWSGVRPLCRDPEAEGTSDVPRDHVVFRTPSGMFTTAGGKWTTYRSMASHAVDFALRSAYPDKPLPECRTTHTRLIGAHGWTSALTAHLAHDYALPGDVADHLSHSYGGRAHRVAALAAPAPTQLPPQAATATASDACAPPPRRAAGPLARRLSPRHPFIEAEVLYAVDEEHARTAADVLVRRTRFGFIDQQAALQAVPRVVELMGDRLRWDAARRAHETAVAERYLADTMAVGQE